MFRIQLWRRAAGLLVVAVAGSVVAVGTAHASAAAAPRDEPRAAATRQAAAVGHPVAVPALTTATSTTVANPNGTFTTTTSELPTRMKVGGAWRSIDPTLRRAADGGITTTATPNRLTLSGGGHGALVSVADDTGHSLGLTLPTALPTPTLNGATATYRDVYPGVDLVVTAEDSGGFREVFTVHDATAANIAKHIRFGTTLHGLRLRQDAAGNLSAVDTKTGRPVLTAPPAAMWDSSDRGSSSDRPGMHARVAALPMSVDATGMTLSGAVGQLGTGKPHYPVYLDPTWTFPEASGGTQAYTQVQSGCPNYTYFDVPNLEPGVGYNDFSSCQGAFRAYFQIDTSNVIDPSFIIQSATLKIDELASSWDSCGQSSETITIYTTAPIGSGITWNNKPGPGPAISSQNLGTVGNVDGTMCPGNVVEGDFDVSGGIAEARAGGWPNWTFTMVGDETKGSHSLETFNDNPSITTVYDVPPNTPTGLTATPAPVTAAGTVWQGCDGDITGWLGRSTIGSQNAATLSANLTSPVAAAQMFGHFEFYDHTTSTEWFMDSGLAGSGATVSVETPALTDGHLYTWQVDANDQSYSSPIAHYCGFTVDETPPTNPVITSTDFPPSGSGVVGKTSGQAGSITLTATDPAPASGSASGLRGYLYSLDTPVATNGTPLTPGSGAVTISVTPSMWGTHTLYVEAVDNAGNVSGQSQYSFYVPWNPNTKITPGDVNGDGVPDLLATTSGGNLIEYPGDSDPSAAPVTLSDPAHSPDGEGTPWNKYVVTHRGSFSNQSVDDLWAYDTVNHHLYLYKNFGSNPFENTANVVDVTKAGVALDTTGSTTGQACDVTLTADCSGYDATDWSTVTQVVAVGDLYTGSKLDAAGTNDLLTIEGDTLWLYQGQNANFYLNNPIKLGTSGWSGMTLLAPGVVGGQPVLWARDNTTGAIYRYTITFDANGYPESLGTPSGADTSANQIATGYAPAQAPAVVSPGDTNGDGYPDLYSTDTSGNLWFTAGTSGGLAGSRSLVGPVGTAGASGWN